VKQAHFSSTFNFYKTKVGFELCQMTTSFKSLPRWKSKWIKETGKRQTHR